jgi:hypothetical protein
MIICVVVMKQFLISETPHDTTPHPFNELHKRVCTNGKKRQK